jgi:hypothetical protein
MNRWKNPVITLISNPVNIDRPIQEIQEQLATLDWIEKCFGRSWLAVKSVPQGTTKKLYSVPQVWQGHTDGRPADMLEVLPNDNLKSQVFFRVNDPITIREFVPNGDSMMRASLDIIFWFNLREIDPSIDYVYTELLKGQVQRVFANMTLSPDSDLKPIRIWETAEQVFKGYDISRLADANLVHPWGGFRFECELTYREDCPYTNLELNNAPQGRIMANGGFMLRS